MLRQNRVAKQLEYAFVNTSGDLKKQVEEGAFVPLTGNEHYVLGDGVSHPVARPELRLFIERLAEQYHKGTGEKLVVTSLTRPVSEQPRNSHKLSVHPAGIAVDLRISDRAASRRWLESVLLKLERQGLLDITRERYPPHYHVALFTEAYRDHVKELVGDGAVIAALESYLPNEEEVKPEPVSLPLSAPVSAMAATVTTSVQAQPHWASLLAVVSIFALILCAVGFFAQDALRDGEK
jgi:hypothetical protein